MFDNIGGKIKKLARIVCIIGIIASFIAGILLMNIRYTFEVGLAILLVGPLLSWIGSYFTYGFGQLIENTDKFVGNFNNNNKKKNQMKLSDETPSVDMELDHIDDIYEKEAVTEEEYHTLLKDKLASITNDYNKGKLSKKEYERKKGDIMSRL